jgi:predicted AAA+ superfamily ATPase
MNIQRILSSEIKESLEFFPVVAILGPRQCGKTTLAKEIIAKFPKSIYLDLELHTDLQKLEDPEFYLTKHVTIQVDGTAALYSFLNRGRRTSLFLTDL